MFSDESVFDIYGNRGSIKVWRRKKERFSKECILPTIKHPPSVMIFGRIRILEKGEKMNQVVYKKNLERELQWSIRDLYGNNQVVFQDDNAPCHRAKSVQQYLDQTNILNIRDWPGQSPDINPIENLWADVGAVVRERAPTNRIVFIFVFIRVKFI